MAKKKKKQFVDLNNEAQLDPAALEALIQDFSRLKELDADIPEKLIRYIVDGTDEEVLLSVGKLHGAEETYLLAFSETKHWELAHNVRSKRPAFLFPEEEVRIEFFVRLGEVYDALARTNTTKKIQAPAGWPLWLVLLIREMVRIHSTTIKHSTTKSQWQVQRFAKLLDAAGFASGKVVRFLLDEDLQHKVFGSYYYHGNVLNRMLTGWAEYMQAHVDDVRNAFETLSGGTQRNYAISALEYSDCDFSPLLDVIADCVTAPQKTLRESALPILERHKNQARPHLEKLLAEGPAGVREHAVNALWHLYAKDAEDTLQKQMEIEKSDKLKQQIERLLAAPTGGEPVDFDLPPVEIETGQISLPQDVKDAIHQTLERAYEQAVRNYERELARQKDPQAPAWVKNQPKPTKPMPLEKKNVEKVIEFIEGKGEPVKKAFADVRRNGSLHGALSDVLIPPKVQLIHVVRLAWAFGNLDLNEQQANYYNMTWNKRQELEAYRARCEPNFGLRELDAAVATLPGGQPGQVAAEYLISQPTWQGFFDWEPDAVWPVFAENLDLLQEVLSPTSNQQDAWYYNRTDRRRLVFKILSWFPKLPPQFIPVLWPITVGSAKTDRPLAQEALASVPDKLARILLTLKDGKPAIRAAAAEWLGNIGDTEAIEPLKEAFRKETNESTKGEIIWALEKLGADINEFLDRDKLLEEAKTALAKKKANPKELDYLPLKEIPQVHWQDTGEVVDPQILKWWLVQCIQFKSPACSPLIQRYLMLCRRHEREQLARFVLTHWIAEDVKSSASSGKGLLAIVSAAGDLQCAKTCEQHIKKFAGQKMSQCKSLMEVLSWIDHPQAIQILLSFANRFRTASLRKAASDHVHEMAERQGWTLDELGDRTIPDGGFARPKDENGEPVGDIANLVLDYGARKFTITLDDELQLGGTIEDGKTLKNPPSPG